jgi:hypothetical protein
MSPLNVEFVPLSRVRSAPSFLLPSQIDHLKGNYIHFPVAHFRDLRHRHGCFITGLL